VVSVNEYKGSDVRQKGTNEEDRCGGVTVKTGVDAKKKTKGRSD